jgi:hypothetical protein
MKMDDTQMHHFDPKSKWQLVKYAIQHPQGTKNFKSALSAGKIMATFFWDNNVLFL